MWNTRPSPHGRQGRDTRFFRDSTITPIALALIVLLLASTGAHAAVRYQDLGGWRDAGPAPTDTPFRCFDTTRPTTFLVSYDRPEMRDPIGTYAYNWSTGEYTRLSEHPFTTCSEANGLLFMSDYSTDTAVRFSRLEPQGRQIAHAPTHIAVDGTIQVYAVHGRLWASADGGLTWHERGQQFHGAFDSIVVSPADARALYAFFQSGTPEEEVTTYSIYFSPDAGATWERRYADSLQRKGQAGDELRPYNSLVLGIFTDRTAPVEVVRLAIHNGWPGLYDMSEEYLSIDGARTFRKVGENHSFHGGSWIKSTQLLHTSLGVIRLAMTRNERDSAEFLIELSLSSDGGQTWQQLVLPAELTLSSSSTIEQADQLPNNLFLTDANHDLWHSPDSGRTWRKLAQAHDSVLTPYLPAALIGVGEERVSTLDLPDAASGLAMPVMPSGASGSSYFSQTSHNLAGAFKQYWELHGGLAQFGYPKTEPFRELNPADGQIYLVQYFERNRFEYHPELAGTAHEVLLGLLGNQVTEQRRAGGEAPFNRIDNPNRPEQRYFPETGHSLSAQFRAYWEATGGLGVYGYPISEPFVEVNPADGQGYWVQYFERNRFEYHPELAGTPYEVLLGLLGNQVLQQKGVL